MPSSAMCKVTVSLPQELVAFADRLAGQSHTSRSQVISQVLAEAQARERTRLAEEGYRFYARESADFAAASAQAVAEVGEDYSIGEQGHASAAG